MSMYDDNPSVYVRIYSLYVSKFDQVKVSSFLVSISESSESDLCSVTEEFGQ